ncbi:cation:proton antiporter [Bacteroidota bacterium]
MLIIGIGLGFISRLGLLENGFKTLDISLKWAGEIDPHLILFVFLPTLIFEAAFALDVHTFKKSVSNAIILAIPGIIIAMFLTGALAIGMKSLGLGLDGWGWSIALMFGAVVSATDPVAVVSLLKGLGASKKLGTLIEGESLLNDGTAIVIFMVFFLALTGVATDTSAVVQFFQVAIGGILLGIVIGAATIAWVKRVFNDAMVEITVIIVAAYLTFYIAEDFLHISGVLGLVALGLAMASVGKTRISPEVEHFLHEFWELAAFIANTLIFVIVGVVIAQRVDYTGADFLILLIIYVGIHIVRAIVIVLFYPFMKRLGYGLPKKDAYILWWGALRGAIGLALALVVAGVDSRYIPAEISNQFLSLIAGVVTLTLLINATTIGWFVRKLGLTKLKPARALMIYSAREYLRSSSENSIEKIKSDKYMKTANWSAVAEFLPEPPVDHHLKDIEVDTLAETRIRILEKEKGSYWSQFKEGLIGSSAVRHLTEAINDEIDAGGTNPLSEREDLEAMWKTPKLLSRLQNSRLFGGVTRQWFFERLSVSYDTARGLMDAQDESVKLVESMMRHINKDKREEEEQILELVLKEINKNKVYAQTFIRSIRKIYPEIYNGIATRQAIRTVLNYEKRTVERLQKNGRISSTEAENMIESIEERMKKLVYSPLKIKLPKTHELLKDIPWLRSVSFETMEKVVNLFQHRVYSLGENLMTENDPADSIFVIIRGTVKVTSIGNLIERLGPGNSLGVINILTNQLNDVTVTAESPVTALRIKYVKLQRLLKESKELEESLWGIAAIKIAENVVKGSPAFSDIPSEKLKSLLSKGITYTLKMDQLIKVKDSIVVLLEGSIFKDETKSKVSEAPTLILKDAVMASEGRVFACAKGNKES